MNLSAHQLRSLERSWSYRESPPTVARLLRASWRTYLIQVVLLGGVAAFGIGADGSLEASLLGASSSDAFGEISSGTRLP